MLAAKKKSLIDGPIFWTMFMFAVPLMLTNILQVLYNMADGIIVGRYSGDTYALASVTAGANVNMLFLNFMFGLSIGASVITSHYLGARDKEGISKSVHTAILFSIIFGMAIVAVANLAFAPVVSLVGIKEEYVSRTMLYLRILSIGYPALTVFNFGAGILRASGDSRSPLYILSATGLLNVLCNFIFVIGFGMSVDGVAIATVISQYVSVGAVLYILVSRKSESYALYFKKLAIDRTILGRMVSNGLASGVQSSMFSIGNLFITGAIHSFTDAMITGSSVASNVNSITYVGVSAYNQTSLTFAGQNYGARKPDRIKKSLVLAMAQVTVICLVVGWVELLFADGLTMLFIDPNEPLAADIKFYAREVMFTLLPCYFVCGIMEVLIGSFRALEYAFSTMIIVLIFACFFRIAWVLLVFPLEPFNNLTGLYMQYVISWILPIIALGILYFVSVRKKLNRLVDKSRDGEKILTRATD